MARFSVNKLGEYLNANASRRIKLIEDQKNPSKFIVTRYSDARDIIIDYFISNYDSQIIHDGIQQLTTTPALTDFQISDRDSSIKALNSILQMTDKPNLTGLNLTRSPKNELLHINGVDISVNPDLIVHGSNKKGDFIGAIKFHISSSNSLPKDSMLTVSTILHKWVETFHCLTPDKVASKKYCLSIDIFSQSVHSTPTSIASRMSNINSSCNEIALRWPIV